MDSGGFHLVSRLLQSMKANWLILLLLYAGAGTALASECYDALQPLMLEQNPDVVQVRQARAICTREADAGDVDARYRLSFFYLGLSEWRPDEAVRLIDNAAVDGIPEAQYWLGWQYESGPLLPDDHALALRWYQAAAGADHRLALERLARAYGEGELGLQADTRKASVMSAAAARCDK
jgi:TPR repeat protein